MAKNTINGTNRMVNNCYRKINTSVPLLFLMRGFYFITDGMNSTKTDLEAVKEALDGGASLIQYRDKERSPEEKIPLARKLRLMCSGRAIFIINDDVEVAAECDAYGIHLGQDDISLKTARYLLGGDKLIGMTVHNVEQAIKADKGGADYVAISPIFATGTKSNAGEPVGLQMIRDVKAAVKMPVAAIGGINESNVDSVISSGADMVCAISATAHKQDIKSAVRYFSSKWKK
jgi:thiamine-phosphate pyrophosphorylase